MLGAIIGDIIGSKYEFNPIKTKDFDLFPNNSTFTDDTVLTIATADAILNNTPYAETYRKYFRDYPLRGFGTLFYAWGRRDNAEAYNSFGNGSAMRVAPIGWAFNTLEEVLAEARKSAEVSHNHPEGIKGAQAVASAIFLARTKISKEKIKEYIESNFEYDLSRSVDITRETSSFNESCPISVPEAIICFLDSNSFEDAVRNAVSLGGDADTQACIAGSIAEAFYKEISEKLKNKSLNLLPEKFIEVIDNFNQKLSAKYIPKEEARSYKSIFPKKISRITLTKGDITIQKVDAIVNAANRSLRGGGGVDGAIHDAAGDELYEECAKLEGCETGQSKITKGYKLPAKHVIHTVGPDYGYEKGKDADLLKSCYLTTLKLAEENGLKTIAFPAISVGVFHYPLYEATKIAVESVKEFINQKPQVFDEIRFVAFNDDVYNAYADKLSYGLKSIGDIIRESK